MHLGLVSVSVLLFCTAKSTFCQQMQAQCHDMKNVDVTIKVSGAKFERGEREALFPMMYSVIHKWEGSQQSKLLISVTVAILK